MWKKLFWPDTFQHAAAGRKWTKLTLGQICDDIEDVAADELLQGILFSEWNLLLLIVWSHQSVWQWRNVIQKIMSAQPNVNGKTHTHTYIYLYITV